MRVVIFTHSLVSDWNHGNAHFLRGLATELQARGCKLRIFEPEDGWSRCNLLADAGPAALVEFEQVYPQLRSELYSLRTLDLDEALRGADVVVVHEWNAPELIAAIGRHRAARGGYRLYFHDTHHRSLTDAAAMSALELQHYDGVLAYGDVIRRSYMANGWASRAWTFHEAADTRVFRPMRQEPEGELVWIGNWGDGERARELREFLIDPVRRLGLRAKVYGVRYPQEALAELEAAGIEYGGWLANYRVPETFARYRVTVHVPRGPYAATLHGIPTIRPFEALACGIPMISAPWQDSEALFGPKRDYLQAKTGAEMTAALREVLTNSALAAELAENGLKAIRTRHTCGHRAEQLMEIVNEQQARAEAAA